MSTENKEQMSIEMCSAVSDDQDLRERVRGIVMRALADRQWDRAEIREVLRESFAGLGQGLGQRGGEAAGAVKEAVHGLDEAVGRSVYALRMAVEESWSSGRDFAQSDLKAAVDALRDLEKEMLDTLKDSADKSQGWVKDAFADLHAHLSRNGTDTGSQVKDVVEALGSRLGAAAHGAAGEAREQARSTGERLGAVASGILRGLADALDGRKS
ncbi:MAG: DUF6781 family protein [Pseudomonadota bacterium]